MPKQEPNKQLATTNKPTSDTMTVMSTTKTTTTNNDKKPMPSVVVFSGGSGFNSLVGALSKVTTNVAYILPVSDDGGSTSEIVRAFGGPGIGDLRSRLLRLASNDTDEDSAVKRLLSYRLPSDQSKALNEWENILHGRHELWANISVPARESMLAFLSHFQKELSKRMVLTPSTTVTDSEYSTPQTNSEASPTGTEKSSNNVMISPIVIKDSNYVTSSKNTRPPPARNRLITPPPSIIPNYTIQFDFRTGSIGNFLLTGCRLFFKSLDAALFQITKILSIPKGTHVLPITSHVPEKKVKRVKEIKSQIYLMYRRNNEPICDFDPLSPTFGTPELDNSITIIAANLRNGEQIIGQCSISHPGSAFADTISEEKRASMVEMSPVGYTAKYDFATKSYHSTPYIPQFPASRVYNGNNENNVSLSVGKGVNDDDSIEKKVGTPVDNDGLGGIPFYGIKSNSLSALPSPEPDKIHSLASNNNNNNNNNANLFYSKVKHACVPLPSPIRRVYYVNIEGQEVLPKLNSNAIEHLETKSSIIYSIGSLYTSLLPSLIVEGVGRRIAQPIDDADFNHQSRSPKILLLNSTWDRETYGYTALDFIFAITDALNYSHWCEEKFLSASSTSGCGSSVNEGGTTSGDDFVFSGSFGSVSNYYQQSPDDNNIITFGGGGGEYFDDQGDNYSIDIPASSSSPVKGSFSSTGVAGGGGGGDGESLYSISSPGVLLEDKDECWEDEIGVEGLESENNRRYIDKPHVPSAYITHLVYLSEAGDIKVDVDAIERLGIQCVPFSGKAYNPGDMENLFRDYLV